MKQTEKKVFPLQRQTWGQIATINDKVRKQA
jgi:hypothetical protein